MAHSLTDVPPCPICHRPQLPSLRPFCSPRCAEVDLGRWLTAQYAIPDPIPPEDPTPQG